METDTLRAWKAKGKGTLRNAGGNKEKKEQSRKRGKTACGGKVEKDMACLDRDREKERENGSLTGI